MTQQIITAWEVIRYSPAGRDYPTTHVCDRIGFVEADFGIKYLGEEAYEYLLSHLTAIPTGAVEWDADDTYGLGAVVVREQCMFTSTTAGNTTDPLDDGSDWLQVKKFTTACLNELWEDHMRAYLAFRVYSGSVQYTTIVSTAGGLVVRAEEGGGRHLTRAAKKEEIVYNNSHLANDMDLIMQGMLRWFSKNGKTCGIPSIAALNCNAPVARKTSYKRRWALK